MYPQVGKDSDSSSFQDIYWRCIFCLFESSKRLNSNVDHILFVNQYPPPEIDDISTQELISAYNITVVKLNSLSIPPDGYTNSFNSQFIVLDVIDWLSEHFETGEEVVILLDGDCIFNNSISDEFIDDVVNNGALLYSLDYPKTHNINGLSRIDLKALSVEYDPELTLNDFVYNGGEFFCVVSSILKTVAKEARSTYKISLERYESGLRKFNEEAQLLSYVYHKLGYKTHTANKYIERIFTNRGVYCNVDGTEENLIIWHLPGEKKRGFVALFSLIGAGPLSSDIQKDLMRLLHISENPFIALLQAPRWIVRKIYHKLRGTAFKDI